MERHDVRDGDLKLAGICGGLEPAVTGQWSSGRSTKSDRFPASHCPGQVCPKTTAPPERVIGSGGFLVWQIETGEASAGLLI
jgi:hypothetical protein